MSLVTQINTKMAVQTINIPFVPNAGQAAFLEGKEFIKLCAGGWGAGKTVVGAIAALKKVIANPGKRGFIAAPTYNMLMTVTLKEFFNWCPKALIARIDKQERTIYFINGAEVYWGSTDRPFTLEGKNITWFWLDEARFCKVQAWEFLKARMRIDGPDMQGLLTSTPAMNYLHKEFKDQTEDRGLYKVRTAENIHLPKKYIEDMERSLSPEMFRVYMEGEFVYLAGGVFPNFLGSRNVYGIEYDPHEPVEMGIDFGINKPAVVFCQHFRRCPVHMKTDCVHVIGELMPDNVSTYQLGAMMRDYMSEKLWKGRTCYVDPAGLARGTAFGYKDIDALEAQGFLCEYTNDPRDKHIPSGIELMRSKIQNYKKETTLYFSSEIEYSDRGIVRSIQESVYPERGGADIDKPTKDGVFDHARDALRYYLINKFPISEGFQL